MTQSVKCQGTVRAASIGYIVQSLINNFTPLLFVTFQTTYDVTLSQISIIIMVNFCVQVVLDMIATFFADRIGLRRCIVTAHFLAAAGIAGLAILPGLFANPIVGLVLAAMIYGAGGGLNDALLTPIVQYCPIERKDKAVSMLHSFFSWGSVIVIVASTLFFHFVGINNWKLLALIWAILPILNGINFLRVPIYEAEAKAESMSVSSLFKSGIFWILLVIMFCTGVCELTIAQWGSAFAEKGLHLSKSVGDLVGPCLFGVLLSLERVWYGKKGNDKKLWKTMLGFSVVCLICYCFICFTESTWVALGACALAGFFVGIMWPGTHSLAVQVIPKGGTAMFGMLALAGDLGCAVGPAVVGVIAKRFGDSLQMGFLFAGGFAGVMILALLALKKKKRNLL